MARDVVTLQELIEPGRNITYGVVKPGPAQDDGVPFIRGGDVLDGRVLIDDIRTITPAVSAQYKRTVLRGGELLVSLVGNPGEVALAPESLVGANIARQVGLIPLATEVNSRFIMYYLMSPRGRADLFMRTGGAVQQVINLTDLKSIEVPLPPRPAQDKTARVLSAYDELIDNNRRRMALLEEAARLLYCEWFTPRRFPGHEHTTVAGPVSGWRSHVLGDLCTQVRESVQPGDMDPDTPYIGLEHMPRRSICLDQWGTAVQVASSKHRFMEGDILFGKIRPYFHKVGVALVDGVASSDAIVIRPKDPKYHALVLLTVSSDPFVAMTSQTMREGSKMPRADWGQMEAYPVHVPPPGLLGQFEETVSVIVRQLRTLAFSKKKARAARDLLLPRLMSGEIAV